MLKEIKNNVCNALFVAADEDGQRYAAFESDWNGEYWKLSNCNPESPARLAPGYYRKEAKYGN